MRASSTLLIAFVVLSGCAGSGGDREDADGIQDIGSEHRDLGGLAAVAGRIADEANRSVPGAIVAPVDSQTPAITTAADGLFRFEGLQPGPAKLHIVAHGYQTRVVEFTAMADRVVRLGITLIELETVGPSYRLHVHDYWRGQETYELMDGSFVVTDKPVAEGVNPQLYQAYNICSANTNGTCAATRWIPLPQSEPGHPIMVIPGTGRIEVTLDWKEPELRMDQMGLGYIAPDAEDRVWLGTRARGEPWSIPVSVDQFESGHQEWTFWRFFLYYANTAASPTTWEPSPTLGGTVHAKILLHKAAEPYLEPAHPTFWNGSDQMQVMDGEWDVNPYNLGSPGGDSIQIAYLPAGRLVPPGTARMVIEFSWDMGPGNGLYEQRLKWRSADQNPASTGIDDFRTAAFSSCGERCIVFDLEIDGRTADQPYQKKSGWAFFPHPEPFREADVWAEQNTRYFAKITLYKDPAYEEPGF